MEQKGKTTSNRKMTGIILGVIGIVLVIVGIAIITIHGNPLRGSGLGTISTIIGILLLIAGAVMFSRKRS